MLNKLDSETLNRTLSDYSKDIINKFENLKNTNIKGFDLSKESLALTRKNIKAAGLDKYITTELQDAQRLTPPFENGILFCNPPYGERLSDEKQLEKLYYNLGENLKRNFIGHTAWIFTGNPELRKKLAFEQKNGSPFLTAPLSAGF